MKRALGCLGLVLFWSLAGSSPAAADPAHGNGYGHIKRELVDYFEELTEDRVFSGSVLVARDGKVLLAKGFGLANYEEGIRNKKKTVFFIASLSKAFASTSIMMLEEQGLLSLDDTVAEYFPGFPEGESITLRHLLGMTSGIYNFTNHPGFWENMHLYHTPQEIFPYFVDEPRSFEPGADFEYCNSGWVLLGLIIEQTSGLSLRDFLWLNIFQPLGMDSTSYDEFLVDFPDRAVGYDDLSTDPPNVSPLLHPSVAYAAGGILSTVKDLYKWDQALYTEELVSADSLEEMLTPSLGDYGLGWYIDTMEIGGESYEHAWHWGAYIGYHSYFSRLVDERITVIVLSNLHPPTFLPDQLRPVAEAAVAIVLGEEAP